jgi:hypothetical protein
MNFTTKSHTSIINFTCITLISMLALACNKPQPTADTKPEASPIEGTWELLSETKIEKSDTTFTPAAKNQRMIKIINKTHFAFLRHDLNGGKDSTNAIYVAGGGTYEFKDGAYTEHLEFLNFRDWENHDFHFTVKIQNDTLIQQGQEKVEGTDIDRYIIEKYARVSK